MTAPTPLRPNQVQPEAPLESPEILCINAMLDLGEFRPERHGLHVDMLGSHHKAWMFCQNHQEQTGSAPSHDLFHASFPDLQMVEGVKIEWAADLLRTAHYERHVRKTMQAAIAAINDKDYVAAQEAVREAAQPHLVARPKGLSVYDVATIEEANSRRGWPTPYAELTNQTGGLCMGDLWYLAARLGQGKSWLLPLYAVVAAEYGCDVAVLSLEMSKKVYARRLQLHMARGNVALQRGLESSDRRERMAALERLPKLPGTITVLDPMDVKMTTRAVETAAVDHQLVLVDHVGLLMDSHGKRAVEDWRTMAIISNTLKEIALAQDVAILGAAQVNREGESARHTAPKVSQLSQSDALGQDAEVVVTLRRLGEGAMLHQAPKNRNGGNAKWYTRFLPGTADFSEISKDEALDIQRRDEERNGDS